jgi:alpha-glucosidase
MGFELKDEPAMTGDFEVTDHSITKVNEKWTPAVKSKHAEITDNYNQLYLFLKEKTGPEK